MKSLLEELGYTINKTSNVWVHESYRGINYSDGDATESKIAQIITDANDISILSAELRSQCTDWPTRYHLSGSRANILRPIENFITGKVLEIGAGCGAITRYLGELGVQVLALEGSPRRAAIARSRTRDLENVYVLAERFNEFESSERFDVITLIGVLEYANLFTPGDAPANSMLQRIRTLLKPDGKLIIAIENQLGLKYFAGAAEDHLGIPMYGVEGKYTKNSPQTFGRATLENLLRETGFINSEFLTPLPDYKLPSSIVTKAGLNNKRFDSAAFAWQSACRDQQLSQYPNFSLENTWPEIFKNGLAMDLANSFLVITSPAEQVLAEAGVLAYHYSTERQPKFCKETRFVDSEDGDINVLYKSLTHHRPTGEANELVKLNIPHKAKYSVGKTLSLEFVNRVSRDGWSIDDIGKFLTKYVSVLERESNTKILNNNEINPEQELPGKFFDVIPQNIILGAGGDSYSIIDTEWELNQPISVGYLLFRSIMAASLSITIFGKPANVSPMTLRELIIKSLRSVGLRVTGSQLTSYIQLESRIQTTVSGRESDDSSIWQNRQIPTMKSWQAASTFEPQYHELSAKVESLNSEVASLNSEVTSLNSEVVQRGQWATNLQADLTDTQHQLAEILQSNSWRLTRPLREARRWVADPKGQAKRYARKVLTIAKRVYFALPLSPEMQAMHRRFATKHLGWLLKAIRSGQQTPEIQPLPFPVTEPIDLTFQEELDLAKGITLNTSATPLISVIIPIYGQCNYTLLCLASIAKHAPSIPYEIIVVDDYSPDHSREIIKHVANIKFIENPQNQGFIRSCNIGAKAAAGEYVCFLNNDTQVAPGWLEELHRTFIEFPGTGLAGSKLVYPNGVLQEAGGILWQDGSAWNFGRNQDPRLPIYNYARETDYCSGASIMVPAQLFKELGGFDEHYLPAYCEDSDLALKIRSHGYRVIYQPLSVVVHFEGITSGTDTTQGAKAYQIENSKKLFHRWKEQLASHQVSGADVDSAKDRMAKKRVLVLDHCTPTPDQDAGSVSLYNIMLLLRDMDFQVTFIPEDNFLYAPSYTPSLQRAGIEVLYSPWVQTVEQHLQEFGGRYDLVFLFRPTVVERNLSLVKKYSPQAKTLFYTHDLHYLRMTREAQLDNDARKMRAAEAMKMREFAAIEAVDRSILVSTAEQELLEAEIPDARLAVFPLILDIPGTQTAWEQRKDIVFVGGFQHTPNVDAMLYFCHDVMPHLRSLLPDARIFIVGSKPPQEIQALQGDDIIVTGFVDDLHSLLERVRVSVAPLRFGAGIKGKIGTALAAGLPTVATSLAAEGMSLTNEENILLADEAEDFAKAIARLYNDEQLWNHLNKAGISFAEKAWGAKAAWQGLAEILDTVELAPEPARHPLRLYSQQRSH